ncbi:hypothetical protein V8F06_010918, partial [Rhypophila decipiens]
LTGMSNNYRGDPANLFNHSANGLSDEDNCSFWITQMYADVQVNEILREIRGIGRVYALHINRQEAYLRGAAAKLVFFTKAAARRFFNAYMVGQNLVVRGKRAHIAHNRVKVPEQTGLPGHYTRCLRIIGPYSLLRYEFLGNYLEQRLQFEIDTVNYRMLETTLGPNGKPRVIVALEIRFSSYRGQAALVYQVLTRD